MLISKKKYLRFREGTNLCGGGGGGGSTSG
jgi:hypothetical protein